MKKILPFLLGGLRGSLLGSVLGSVLPGVLTAQGLQLSPDVYLVATGTPNVVLNNTGIVNNGLFIPGNSTLLLTGDDLTTVQYLGGSQTLSLYNVVIATASHAVRLDNDVLLSHAITLDSGNLDLNGHLLDLGSTGSIFGERDGACITGITGGLIRRSAEMNAPQEFNPGNIGVAISSPADLGMVTIIRGHVAQPVAGGITGIQRYFDIEPAANSGLQATLRLYYFDGELAGNSKPGLTLFSTTDAGTDWQALGAAKTNTDSNWVVQTRLDQLHRFTLATGTSGAADRISVEAYPNPIRDGFQLKLTTSVEKDATIGLYDATGQLLEVRQVHCLAGTTIVQWGVTRYAAGIYYVGVRGLAPSYMKLIRL